MSWIDHNNTCHPTRCVYKANVSPQRPTYCYYCYCYHYWFSPTYNLADLYPMIPFPLYAVALCNSAYFFMSFLQITFMCKVTCVCIVHNVLYCSLYVHMYGFLPPFRLERVIKASCDSKRDPVEPYSLQQTAPQSPLWKRFFLSNKNINGWLLLHTYVCTYILFPMQSLQRAHYSIIITLRYIKIAQN